MRPENKTKQSLEDCSKGEIDGNKNYTLDISVRA